MKPSPQIKTFSEHHRASQEEFPINLDLNWDNALFEDHLCNALEATYVTILKITDAFKIADSGRRFILPDCFYTLGTSLQEIYLTTITISGNSTENDPMERLGKALPSLTYFGLTNGNLTDSNGDGFHIDWNSTFTALPSVISYEFRTSYIGSKPVLPTELPTNVFQFAVVGCSLSGEIPSTLFSQHSGTTPQLYLFLSENDLTGTLPANLFPNDLCSNLELVNVDLSQNELSGSIPSNLFGGVLKKVKTYSMDVGSNLLDGDVMALLPTDQLIEGTLNKVLIYFDANKFTGSIPNWLQNIGSNVTDLIISGSSNSLESTLPIDLTTKAGFTAALKQFQLILSGNKFFGDIPSNLFDFNNVTVSPTSWFVDLSKNNLNGTIATDVFSPINWTLATEAIFRFGTNPLIGDLPASVLKNAPAPALGTLNLNFGHLTKLTGTVPDTFWESMSTSSTLASTAITTKIDIDMTASKVTGALNLPDLSLSKQSLSLSITAPNCNFTTVNFTGAVGNVLMLLNLHSNSMLKGALPASLFDSSSILSNLTASGTLLSGTMPDLGALSPVKLRTLILDSTLIDFCSGARTAWAPEVFDTCTLTNTSASNCAGVYAVCTVTTNPSTTPPTAPPSRTCPPTRPSADFVCIAGVWTSITSINTPTFIVPSGATTTVINGNLTSSTVVIQGLGSTVIVTGCVSNLTTITVELTKTEIEKIGTTGKLQSLLSYNASDVSCSNNLESVNIDKIVSDKTCKEVKVSKVQSEGSLSALFTVNNSKCNTWWIILVSVICGVVVIGIVVAVVVIKFVQKSKWRRSQAALRG